MTYIDLTIQADNGLNPQYPFILQEYFANALNITVAQIHACYDYTVNGGEYCTFPDLTGSFDYILNITSGVNCSIYNCSVEPWFSYQGNGSSYTAQLIVDYINNNPAEVKAALNITGATIPCQPLTSSNCIPQNRPRNLGIMIGLATFLFILTIIICVVYYARKAHTWSKSYGGTGKSTESTASMNEEMSGRSGAEDN